jgi:hypothetical protein
MTYFDKQMHDLIGNDDINLTSSPHTLHNLKEALRQKRQSPKVFLNAIVATGSQKNIYLTLLKLSAACILLFGIYNLQAPNKNNMPIPIKCDTTQLMSTPDTNSTLNYTDSISSIL